MATLTDADIKRPSQREYITSLEDTDIFVVEDVSEQKIKPITKTNAKATLGITDAEGMLADHETRLDTLESDDTTEGSVAKTVKDAVEPIETRLDTTELTLARQGQDLASVKQTLQQGNGTTLDFEDIGIVPLDARATGRANPTVDGRTATNLLGTDGGFEVDSNVDGIADGLTVYQDALCTYSLDTDVSLTGKSQKIVTTSYSNIGFTKNTVIGHVYLAVAWVKSNSTASIRIQCTNNEISGYSPDYADIVSDDTWRKYTMYFTAEASTTLLNLYHVTGEAGTIYFDNWYFIDLTSIYGAGNEPTEADCAKIFSYFDGTKSIQLPAKVRSVGKNLFDGELEVGSIYFDTGLNNDSGLTYTRSKNHIKVKPSTAYFIKNYSASTRIWFVYYDKNRIYLGQKVDGVLTTGQSFTTPAGCEYVRFVNATANVSSVLDNVMLSVGSTATPYEPYTDSTIYIADDEDVRSVQAVPDTVSVVNGEHMLTKRISTPVSVLSGVAVNTTNYPTAKTGGKFAVELTAGGTQIGIIGTDSTSGAGTLRFELATPLTTPLITSGILQAKPNGTVYFEPWYEGSHQTNASSQITLPYEGTIDKVYGYDENLEPYEVPSTGYTLVGTTLTITGAVENEVFYVELSRSEPLAPEMVVNTLNNDQVTLDSADGKYYQIGFTTTNGVPTVTATEVL